MNDSISDSEQPHRRRSGPAKLTTDALPEYARATDVFTVLAADGTEGSVTVTVTGSNDVPVVHPGDDREEAETTTVCGAWTYTLETPIQTPARWRPARR